MLFSKRVWVTVVGLLVVACAALPAAAAPFWVAWEGNDYPENEGWERIHYGPDGPPALRTLSDGIMTLDGLADIEIIDAYLMRRLLNPSEGEEFVAQWGVRVSEVSSSYPYDPGFELMSDDGWGVAIVFGEQRIQSILEQIDFSIVGGQFLACEFRSRDMRTYQLSIDGSVVHEGVFISGSALASRVYWGDDVAGATSLSDWDYFRFGVVPEVSSGAHIAVMLAALGLCFSQRRK